MRRIVLLTALSLVFPSSLPAAQSPADLLAKMSTRQGFWIAYRARVTARFSAGGREAACRGELRYHRLDEKIYFRCFGENQNLLFLFRTDDRFFDLYLAAPNRVYRGNILDVENAPQIESALKPLALYRALKPMAASGEGAEVSEESGQTWLRIRREWRGQSRPFREAQISAEGDVPYEVYYDAAGRPSAVIERADYRREQRKDRTRSRPVFLPRRILIRHLSAAASGTAVLPETDEPESRTELVFEDLALEDHPAGDLWQAEWPADAEIIRL